MSDAIKEFERKYAKERADELREAIIQEYAMYIKSVPDWLISDLYISDDFVIPARRSKNV